LLANGIDASKVEVVPDEVLAVDGALDMAAEGDLIVLFVDNVRRCWNQVIHYEGQGARAVSSETAKPVHSFVEADPDAFSFDSNVRLVRDERGVRVAREEEAD
jgi:cyanophycin synthetase